ncbi:MAG TPA: hypothetical protein VN682_20305 [Terriglobales bacterium]|nr:hypothetical protein [Terriglobales bacterium]
MTSIAPTTCDGWKIEHNNLNGHSLVSKIIRLNHTSNTWIERNVLSVTPATGIGIQITSNATSTNIGPNEYLGTSGGAVATSDPGGLRTQYFGNPGNGHANSDFIAPDDRHAALVLQSNSASQIESPFIVCTPGCATRLFAVAPWGAAIAVNGSVGGPAHAFTSAPTTGMFLNGSDLGFAVAGLNARIYPAAE